MGADRDSLTADMFGDTSHASARSADRLRTAPASFDTTLPPTPLRELLAADGATIFVLSADRELTYAVEEAGGDLLPIHIVASWTQLVDAVVGRRTHIVLLDTDALPVALADAVEELHDAAPVLVVLVAARPETSQALMSLLSDRQIHRLLIKPAAEGITRLLLESAVGRYLELRDHHEAPVVLVEDFRPPPRRYKRPRASWSPWLLATALVATFVGAMIVGELYGVRWGAALERVMGESAQMERGGAAIVEQRRVPVAEPGDASVAEPADASVAEPGDASVAEPAEAAIIELGQTAEVEPAPVADVESAAAAEAESVTAPVVESAAAAVVKAGDAPFVDRETPLAADDRREPQAATIAVPPRAAPSAQTPADPEAEALFELIDARLAAGRLLAPENDNAMSYFERAVALYPYDPRVVSRRAAIAAGLVDAARAALERADLDVAQRLAADAFRLGAERASLARLDRDLVSARRAQTIEAR